MPRSPAQRLLGWRGPGRRIHRRELYAVRRAGHRIVGFLSAGFTLSPRLRLGAEANAGFDGQDDINQRLALFGASL